MTVLNLALIAMTRRWIRVTFGSSIPFEYALLILALGFHSWLKADVHHAMALYACLVVLAIRETLREFQRFFNCRPLHPMWKGMILLALPLISLNGLCLLVFGLMNTGNLLSLILDVLAGYGVGALALLMNRWATHYAASGATFIGIAFYFGLSGWLQMCGIVFLYLSLVLLLGKSLPSDCLLDRVKPSRRVHSTWKSRILLQLSIWKWVHTLEMSLLFLLWVLVVALMAFEVPLVPDGPFILGLFLTGIFGLLSNNLFGLEGQGCLRTQTLPLAGYQVLKFKVYPLTAIWLFFETPMLVIQLMQHGLKNMILTLLCHLTLGSILLILGLKSSVEHVTLRSFFPDRTDAYGGIRYTILTGGALLVFGFTLLTLFRKAPQVLFWVLIPSCPTVLWAVSRYLFMCGETWDRSRP